MVGVYYGKWLMLEAPAVIVKTPSLLLSPYSKTRYTNMDLNNTCLNSSVPAGSRCSKTSACRIIFFLSFLYSPYLLLLSSLGDGMTIFFSVFSTELRKERLVHLMFCFCAPWRCISKFTISLENIVGTLYNGRDKYFS